MFRFIKILCMVQMIRWGWYKYRKELGYPISLRCAMFSQMPRFGVFEEHEAGCPESDKRDYALVRDYETENT